MKKELKARRKKEEDEIAKLENFYSDERPISDGEEKPEYYLINLKDKIKRVS